MAMTASTLVQRYLIGDFPASKDELLDRAERQGAGRDIIGTIRNLPGDRFESATAVERALGHEH